MKINDIFENAIIFNEVLDTKIPVEEWKSGPDNRLTGTLRINDDTYELYLEPHIYSSSNRTFNFINISFAKLVDGAPSQQLTLDNKSVSKVLGAITNAFYDKVKQYSYDAIILMASDNVEQRLRVYSHIALSLGQLFSAWKENVSLPNGRAATILFGKHISTETRNEFEQYLQQTGEK